MNFQNKDFKNSIIEKVMENFKNLNGLLQKNQTIKEGYLSYYETILLYSEILLENPIYSTLSFEFFKTALPQFTFVLGSILHQFQNNFSQCSSLTEIE